MIGRDRIPAARQQGTTFGVLLLVVVVAAFCCGCAGDGLSPNWGQSLFAPAPIEKDLSQDDAFVARVKKDKFPSAPATSKTASAKAE